MQPHFCDTASKMNKRKQLSVRCEAWSDLIVCLGTELTYHYRIVPYRVTARRTHTHM